MLPVVLTVCLLFSFGLCDEITQHAEQQIIGGQPALIQTYNYQVQLLYRTNSLICGGSIIHRSWILTAAHCVEGYTASDLSIRAGSSYQGNGGVVIGVKQIKSHPSYNSPRYNNDVAVLELLRPLTYGTTINFIPLATTIPADREAMVVTGWGRFSSGGGATAYQLQAVHLPKVNQKTCINNYKKSATITDQMLCAGFLFTKGKDTCNGDSGGPLVYHSYQVGIVSFGKGCDTLFYPTVFANVINLGNWIKQNAQVDQPA